MKAMLACEAKNGSGLMIDMARAQHVLIEKNGRGVVVVLALEEYERRFELTNGEGKGGDGRKKATKHGQ